MKIGIISGKYSNRQNVINESINCFFQYGSFQYNLIQLNNGNFRENLDIYDALFIHYSAIAFPYKHYLPISSEAAIKISSFKGVKIAYVQDEQRAGIERHNFLNMLGIDHLLSVAPEYLHSLLYPEANRNFSLSTVLTGYLTEQHLIVAQKKVNLIDRPVDLFYRARSQPQWMGQTSVLKGEIASLAELQLAASNEDYVVDISTLEKDRIYGSQWFNALMDSKVTISTPSGSSYLDLWGIYNESWVPNKKILPSHPPQKAEYHVISPRYFDYVSSGNLVALTKGSYSGIPLESEFVQLEDDCSNLENILEFANHRDAQRMVDAARVRVLNCELYHYKYFVSLVEKEFLVHSRTINFSNTGGIESHTPILDTTRGNNRLFYLLNNFFQIPIVRRILCRFLSTVKKHLICLSHLYQDRIVLSQLIRNHDSFRLLNFLVPKFNYELYSIIEFIRSGKTKLQVAFPAQFSVCIIFSSPNQEILLVDDCSLYSSKFHAHTHIFGTSTLNSNFPHLLKILSRKQECVEKSLLDFLRIIDNSDSK